MKKWMFLALFIGVMVAATATTVCAECILLNGVQYCSTPSGTQPPAPAFQPPPAPDYVQPPPQTVYVQLPPVYVYPSVYAPCYGYPVVGFGIRFGMGFHGRRW